MNTKKISILVFCLCLIVTQIAIVTGQPKKHSSKKPSKISSVVGKQLIITRTDGSQIHGKLVSLDLQKVVYANDANEQIPIPLENVSILVIGIPPKPQVDAKFISEAEEVLSTFSSLSTAVDANPEQGLTYREYTQKVVAAKIVTESFIAKYSDHTDQENLFKVMRKIISSYESVSPIWVLRLGADQRRSIGEETPELQALIKIYPEIQTTEYNNNGRYPTDKVIAWVWAKTAPQVRALRTQITELRNNIN